MNPADRKQNKQIGGIKAQLKVLHRRVRLMKMIGVAVIMFIAVFAAVLIGGGGA